MKQKGAAKNVMPTNDKPEGDSKFRIALAKTVKRVRAGYERDECNQTAFPPPTSFGSVRLQFQ